MAQFTHLHVASAFSAHYGTARPEMLVAAAEDAGTSAAAITDRDGIYGAVRHIRACIEAGLAPIVGADLQVRDDDELSEVTVLAHGRNHGAGWASMVRLVSAAHSPYRRGQRKLNGTAHRSAWVNRSRLGGFLMGEEAPTATVLLGPRSDVGQAVLSGERTRARSLLEEWKNLLPGGVAVEIVCHRTRPGSAGSLKHAADMLQLASVTETPALLTNAVRYLVPDDALTGDVLDSAANLLPLGKFQPQPNGQAWLKPPEAMHQVAYEITEYAGLRRDTAVDLLTTTEQVAEKCQLDPESDVQWRKPKVPELEVLGVEDDPTRVLSQRCEVALDERYPDVNEQGLAALRDRLQMELSTIQGFGFATYFLTVADVVSLIRGMDVRVQARGSGAGSLVNFLLRVSNVDPIEHDLLFERFLGNKRLTLPDIDIDTESARRHDVYRRIFDHYGHHRVTLLSMQNAYRARGAARDAGLALGLEEDQIDQVAESLWRFNARDFRQVLSENATWPNSWTQTPGWIPWWISPSAWTVCPGIFPCTRAGSSSATATCSRSPRPSPPGSGYQCRSSTRTTSTTWAYSSSTCSESGCSRPWPTRSRRSFASTAPVLRSRAGCRWMPRMSRPRGRSTSMRSPKTTSPPSRRSGPLTL